MGTRPGVPIFSSVSHPLGQLLRISLNRGDAMASLGTRFPEKFRLATNQTGALIVVNNFVDCGQSSVLRYSFAKGHSSEAFFAGCSRGDGYPWMQVVCLEHNRGSRVTGLRKYNIVHD